MVTTSLASGGWWAGGGWMVGLGPVGTSEGGLAVVKQEVCVVLVAVGKVVVPETRVVHDFEMPVSGSAAVVHPTPVVAEFCACSTTPNTLHERSRWFLLTLLPSYPFPMGFFLSNWRLPAPSLQTARGKT